MKTRMLIDARHQEETRVAVLKGNRIEEFDFESADHKQIKGNIYLARVTRVEPSLQAAFVDFGGNRHGFLAFSEIHPDYYLIPKEDREALLAEEAAHAAEEAEMRAREEEEEDDGQDDHDDHGDHDEDEKESRDDDRDLDGDGEPGDYHGPADDIGEIDEVDDEDAPAYPEDAGGADDLHEVEIEQGNEDQGDEDQGGGRRRRPRRARAKGSDELRQKRMALRRRYKIQDVIQRRQVLLVQVAKEERGNKGAALTTYLSLAGRYCVLMPNSSHGGGISRKISNGADRKRLKSIISEMDLPKSMGCIVRTAGLERTKPEIKRDFDYLARLWDEIRERTLKSAAPAAIHSDSDLIKRAIRDIYNRDIEEVIVEGNLGYRAAKDFMKLLMPSHARRVQEYADPMPLFQRYGAEDQLTAMYDPVVQLKSGGYLVINPTEALVSIDINSGRSTKEYGIEATALNTNLEAAREIARQLRLRDMAGLVVIDFIDMEHGSNIRKVEKAMRDALKNDRARIQVGRISGFGLMEMSRQRLRTGVLEATTRHCPHCDGTGLVRTASSAGLSALRMLEDEAAKGRGSLIRLGASQEAAFYVLNHKRGDIAEIESRFGVKIEVVAEGEDEGAKMTVSSSGPRPTFQPQFQPVIEEDDDEVEEIEDDFDDEAENDERDERNDEGRGRKRRKRRRGRKGPRRDDERGGENEAGDADGEGGEEAADETGEAADDDSETAEGEAASGRRRNRRSRRRRRGGDRDGASQQDEGEASDGEEAAEAVEVEAEAIPVDAPVEASVEEVTAEAVPAKRPRRRKKTEAEDQPALEEAAPEAVVEAEVAVAAAEEAPAKPKRSRARKTPAAEVQAVAEVAEEAVVETPPPAATDTSVETVPEAANDPASEAADDGPKRRGWWQRTFGE